MSPSGAKRLVLLLPAGLLLLGSWRTTGDAHNMLWLGTAFQIAVCCLSFLSWLYSLAVLVPSIAVSVRRLHDTGRSGWWLLIGLIPLIGFIVLIVFLATDGEPGDNEYGPNPKSSVVEGAPA